MPLAHERLALHHQHVGITVDHIVVVHAFALQPVCIFVFGRADAFVRFCRVREVEQRGDMRRVVELLPVLHQERIARHVVLGAREPLPAPDVFRIVLVIERLGCGEAVPAKVEDAVGLLREAVERQLVEPEDVPPVLRRINFVIEDDEYILLRRGVVHLEVRKVVGFYLQLPEADHLVAGSDGFVPFGLADPLLRIDVQFGERGVSHRLGYAAVVRGGRHVLQQADVILDLLFDEREEELAIHLPGQARVREVGGEGNIAEQIHGIQIEPCAHDQHLGYQAGFGLEIDRRLVELIEYLVAERNAAEKELPDRLQILHLRIPRVCVHVAPYAVVDPLVSFAQGTDRLVRRYGNRAPDTAVAGIAYQISVNTPGAHQEFFFVVEEFVGRDRGVGILFQVGAGTQYCT